MQVVGDLGGLCALSDEAEVTDLRLAPSFWSKGRLGGKATEDLVLEANLQLVPLSSPIR